MLELNKVIDDIGLGRFHWLLFLFVGTFFIVDNSVLTTAASMTISLERDWHLDNWTKGALVSVIYLGSGFGSFWSGYLSDVYGRRPVLLASLLLEFVFGFACCSASGPFGLLCLRFMFGLGLGIGMAPAISMLVECSPTRWRGHMVNGVTGLMFGLGLLYSCLVILVYMPDLDGGTTTWRYVTALAVLPCVVVMPFVYLLMPESPHYLASRGLHLEALGVLRFMSFINNRSDVTRILEEEASLVSDELESGGSIRWDSQGQPRRAELTNGLTTHTGDIAAPELRGNEGFWEMMEVVQTSGYWPTVMGGMFMYFLVNSTVNGINYGLPQIVVGMHGEGVSPARALFLICLFDYPALVLACVLVESRRISYRTAMKGLCFFSFIFVSMLVSADYGLPRLALFSACMAKLVSGALFQMVFAYFGEVFPTSMRCTANCYCMAVGRLGSVLGPIEFELMGAPRGSELGSHTFFFMFIACLCLVGIQVVDTLLTVEVKNLPLEDFEEDAHICALAQPVVGSNLSTKPHALANSRRGSSAARSPSYEACTDSQQEGGGFSSEEENRRQTSNTEKAPCKHANLSEPSKPFASVYSGHRHYGSGSSGSTRPSTRSSAVSTVSGTSTSARVLVFDTEPPKAG